MYIPGHDGQADAIIPFEVQGALSTYAHYLPTNEELNTLPKYFVMAIGPWELQCHYDGHPTIPGPNEVYNSTQPAANIQNDPMTMDQNKPPDSIETQSSQFQTRTAYYVILGGMRQLVIPPLV